MTDKDNSTAQDAVDSAAEHAHEAVDTAGHAAVDAVGKTSAATSDALGSAANAAGNAVDTTQQAVSTDLRYAAKRAAEIGDKATRSVKSHPGRTALIAAGVVIAAFIIGAIRSKRA